MTNPEMLEFWMQMIREWGVTQERPEAFKAALKKSPYTL